VNKENTMSKNHLAKTGTIGHLDLKWRCLQAWCLTELQTAEEEAAKGKGEKVFSLEIEAKIKEVLERIASEIKANGNTKHILKILDQRNPRIGFYYNEIHKVVNKHFKINEEWITSFFVLNVLSEYKLRGHKGFENIEFFEVIADFEKTVESELELKHFKCAVDVIETMDKLKFSFKKGKR
jgi:hypothetical protein